MKLEAQNLSPFYTLIKDLILKKFKLKNRQNYLWSEQINRFTFVYVFPRIFITHRAQIYDVFHEIKFP